MNHVTLICTAAYIGVEGHMQPSHPLRRFNAGNGRSEMGHMRVDENRARYLIEKGLCRVVRPEPGPTETKPMEPAEKKSFGAATTGLLTDSPSSTAPGKEAASSASEAAPVLPRGNATPRAPRRTRKVDRSAS